MQWIQRPDDYASIEPTGKIQTGYYQLDPSVTDDSKFYAGMDSRSGGGENWNATYTGYYLKKYIFSRTLLLQTSYYLLWMLC